MIIKVKWGVIFLIVLPLWGYGQSHLAELITISMENYPALKAKHMESLAAHQAVRYAQSGIIPKITASYQTNYATANNITGMSYPQYLLPISGPPSDGNSYSPVYGSAASLLMNWQPVTFGKRASDTQVARSGAELALASEELALFEHQIRFVEAYLDYWHAEVYAYAVEKNLNRYRVNLATSRSLSEAGLRPGVDSAQFKALHAKTRIEWLHARKTAEAHRAKALELLGVDTVGIHADPGLGRPPSAPAAVQHNRQHPFLLHTQRQREINEAKKKSLQRSLLPDLQFWGIGFARGSGIDANGWVDRSASAGLSFSRYNYGVGFQLAIPVFDFAQVRHKIKQQDYLVRAAVAYEESAARQLNSEEQVATTALEKAWEAVTLSPEYTKAAEYAYQALQARYDAGLINLTELLQGQADLAQAEADDIKIQTELWKALLYYAAVKGDMHVFTEKLN